MKGLRSKRQTSYSVHRQYTNLFIFPFEYFFFRVNEVEIRCLGAQRFVQSVYDDAHNRLCCHELINAAKWFRRREVCVCNWRDGRWKKLATLINKSCDNISLIWSPLKLSMSLSRGVISINPICLEICVAPSLRETDKGNCAKSGR